MDALRDGGGVPAAVRPAVPPCRHRLLGLLLVPVVVLDEGPRDQPVQSEIVHVESIYRLSGAMLLASYPEILGVVTDDRPRAVFLCLGWAAKPAPSKVSGEEKQT